MICKVRTDFSIIKIVLCAVELFMMAFIFKPFNNSVIGYSKYHGIFCLKESLIMAFIGYNII